MAIQLENINSLSEQSFARAAINAINESSSKDIETKIEVIASVLIKILSGMEEDASQDIA